MPLGTPDAMLQRKIRHADANSLSAERWLDELEKTFYYWEKICGFQSIITNVLGALEGLTVLLGIASQVYQPIEDVWKGACELSDQGKTYWQDIQEVIDPYFCAPITCKLPDHLGYGKIFGKNFDWGKSVVWSIIGLCLPGVLRNLNKLRQIECQRALCLKKDVAQGIPVWMCEEVYHFQLCKYILGELFNTIPFTQVISNYMGQVESYISNPGSLAGYTLTLIFKIFGLCKETPCQKGLQNPKILCSIVFLVNAVGKVVEDMNSVIGPKKWEVSNTLCQQWHQERDKP
jgi:hypothetical protein